MNSFQLHLTAKQEDHMIITQNLSHIQQKESHSNVFWESSTPIQVQLTKTT